MSKTTRNGWAAALLVLAAVLAVVAVLMWRNADRPSDVVTQQQFSDALNGTNPAGPNHTPSVIMLVIAGVSVLAAVGLIAVPTGDPQPQPAGDVAELERLATLRERGHLSSEEFEAQKRRLLG